MSSAFRLNSMKQSRKRGGKCSTNVCTIKQKKNGGLYKKKSHCKNKKNLTRVKKKNILIKIMITRREEGKTQDNYFFSFLEKKFSIAG